MQQAKNEINLILGHGGARALAHVGVIKGMEEENYKVCSLIGTSMGGIVAWFYALNGELTTIESHLENFSINMHKFLSIHFSGIRLKTDTLKDYLISLQGGKDLSFSDLEIPLSIGVTDAKTGKLTFIDRGSVVDTLIASSIYPLWNKPYRINDRDYFDGGMTDIPLHTIPFHFVNKHPYLYINILNSLHKTFIKKIIRARLKKTQLPNEIYQYPIENMKDITPHLYQIDLLVKHIHTHDFRSYKQAIKLGEEAIRNNSDAISRFIEKKQHYSILKNRHETAHVSL